MSDMTTTQKHEASGDQNAGAHPFELAGMGRGPYQFVGMVSIPGAALAEANCEAYNAALRELPRDLIGGCGTCSNCGMAIMNICIIRDADGKRYGVGSDCVLKTDDKALGHKAKIAVAKHRRNLAREAADKRRQDRHAKYLVDHADEIAAKAKLDQERQDALKAGKAARAERFADILQFLTGNDFLASLAEQLLYGPLTVRQAHYAAKACARTGSNRYQEVCERLTAQEAR